VIAVLDASVVLKWFFKDRPGENDTEYALSVLCAIHADRINLIQPPHFIPEVAALLARHTPETATHDLSDLMQIDWQTGGESNDYARAIDMAARLDHHLFDTLYHALALNTPGAVFITADRRYHDKASAHYDQSMLLEDLGSSL